MKQFKPILAILFLAATFLFTVNAHAQGRLRQVFINQGEDRFQPFFLSIRAGDTVEWVNEDVDDHRLVTLNNTVSGNRIAVTVPGLDEFNEAGTFRLRFQRPGTYVYYCDFHASLNSSRQPVAPGPFGGELDVNGNFGTPMMGIIAVSVATSSARRPGSDQFANRR